MFTNFQDYDPYSFYAANRLFFALRKNLQNQGKTIKGKQIRPIKSCLNYTKALMYPMKIEYQREAFAEVISEEFVSKKFDAFTFTEQLKDDARVTEGVTNKFKQSVQDTFINCKVLIDDVLKKSPFQKDTVEYKHLKMSIILSCINILKTKKKLTTSSISITLWKLPKSMSSYVKVLLTEFFTKLKTEIMECYKGADLDDNTLETLISNPAWEDSSHEDQY